MWECRTKSIAALVWVVGLLFIERLIILLSLVVILMPYLLLVERIQLSRIGRRILSLLPFLLLMAVTLSISGGFPLQKSALEFAALICVRVVVAALVLLALTGRQSVDEFIGALSTIGLSQSYMTVLFLTNRYIHLFRKDLSQQMKTLKARMFSPRTDPYTLKNLGYVVGGMFIKAFDRSEHVYRAMKARSYCGVITSMEPQPIRFIDILELIIATVILCTAVTANYLVKA